MLMWQKRARWAVLAIAVAVVAVVFLTTRNRQEAKPPEPVARVDPAAVVESSGAFVVQSKGERETVRIDAEKQLSYPDGSTRLLGVTVTSVRQGKTFVATGEEARVGEDQTNLDMKGNVRLKASDGLEVMANSATYSQSEGIVRAPGPVSFKRGRMTGSGVDFSYDEARDLLGLSDQTRVKIDAAKHGDTPTEITSGAALLARQDKFVAFERAVHIVRGTQVIDAENAVGDLTEDQEHLTGLELQGGARIETPDAAPGELRAMAGDVINLTYYEKSDVLQSAVITTGASLRIAAAKGAPERILHAQYLEIGMAPDGTTVTSMLGRDQVVLDLPGAHGEPAKKIAANALTAKGEAGKGLTTATFTEGVEYSETGGTPTVKRTVTSRDLEMALNGGLGEIREATFINSVRLREGTTGANASTMRYNMQSGQVALTGEAGQAVPRFVNEQMQVDASQIDMNVEGSKLKAVGGPRLVQSIMFGSTKGKPSTRRTPRMMQEEQPVNGLSNELLYTGGDASNVEFVGKAIVWQGEKQETQIKAEKVAIDGKTGNLAAQGSVVSQMMVQDTNPTSNVKETTRSTATAQQMHYDDTLRTVTYTTKAQLVGPQGHLVGETIVLTLGENGQDVQRLEADSNVTMTEADRVTTGDHLVYVAEKQEYNVSSKGKLVRMLSQTEEGCKKSEGNLLTFSRADDRLFIEGREQTRTTTAKDTGCPPAKR
jgi:LPS export ABC transporter protein LptC